MQVVPHNSNVADDTERKGANGTSTPTIADTSLDNFERDLHDYQVLNDHGNVVPRSQREDTELGSVPRAQREETEAGSVVTATSELTLQRKSYIGSPSGINRVRLTSHAAVIISLYSSLAHRREVPPSPPKCSIVLEELTKKDVGSMAQGLHFHLKHELSEDDAGEGEGGKGRAGGEG